MDFFAAQDHARKQTKKLVIYFILAVIGIIASIYLVATVLFSLYLPGLLDGQAAVSGYERPASGYHSQSYGGSTAAPAVEMDIEWWNPQLLALVSGAVLLVVLGASAMKTAALRSGGGAVARSLGGRQIDPGTREPNERRLMNVVEEMALASGTPVPEVYVMDDEEGINAFAAGHNPNDAAVAVTRGCLQTLNRDELQGVIAHEFSHILNGDMRLNVRLIGVLFGILVLAVIGEGMMRSALWSGGGRRNNRDGNNAAIVFMLLGLAIVAIGYIGVLFGRLIQSAISRQREFLADASAVQFTRYPDGIANALIRIGAGGSSLQSQHAQETAHMFFANGLKHNLGGGLATHPPLPERIRAIKPDWNGEFTVPKSSAQARKSPPPPSRPQAGSAGGAGSGAASAGSARSPMPGGGIFPVPVPGAGGAAAAGAFGAGGAMLSPDQVLAAIGTLTVGHVAHAQGMFDEIKAILGNAGTDPAAAKGLVYALMLCEDTPAARKGHLSWLKGEVEAESFAHIEGFIGKLDAAGPQVRLPLLELAMPALAKLDKERLDAFAARLERLAAADDQLTFGELAVVALVRRKVVRRAAAGGGTKERSIGDAAELAQSFSLLLSAVIRAGELETAAGAETNLEPAFAAALGRAPLFAGLAAAVATVDNAALLPALEQLATAAFGLKKQILAALAVAVSHDGKITAQEGEWLRLVAASLDCPMPPLAAAAAA